MTLLNVFFCYFFAYPTPNQDAKISVKVIFSNMTKHAHSPTTLISNTGTAFLSHVIKEVAGVLRNTLKHASTKHARTIGLLEQPHRSIRQALKMETGERRSLWPKYVSNAVLNYKNFFFLSNKYWLLAKQSFP